MTRRDAPAFHRNHGPIWSAIGPFLERAAGDVLEVGSGTGQHAVEFARKAHGVRWWASDVDPHSLASIADWRAQSGLANLQSPLRIDLLDAGWDAACPFDRAVAIVAINVLHISPWRVSENLFAGAARRLGPDGRLFVYGPFKVDGAHTAPSNAAFDATLRAENAEWGVRDMRDLAALAAANGLRMAEKAPMPANNFTLVIARDRDA